MTNNKFGILVLSLLLLTPFRASFIVLTPFVVWWVGIIFNCRFVCKIHLIVTILFLLSTIMGLYSETTNFSNVLLSYWITYPILLLFFSVKCKASFSVKTDFVHLSTMILVVVNGIGIICRFISSDPDVMGLPYGRHFSSQNGLALINALMFIYYFNLYWSRNIRNYLYLSFFFFFSFALCECGLAMICLLITIIVSLNKKIRIKNIIYSTIGVIILVLIIYYNSINMGYYINSIAKISDLDVWDSDFRKISAFLNYSKVVDDNPLSLLFGIGPGGYNGRVSFLLNKDADNIFTTMMGHSMPYYHLKYIHPLWDKSIIDVMSFNDGSRNKPFSSFLSLLAENGIILFFLVLYKFFNTIKLYSEFKMGDVPFTIFATSIFVLMMLVVDQYLESSEMLFFIVFWMVCTREKTTSTFKNSI